MAEANEDSGGSTPVTVHPITIDFTAYYALQLPAGEGGAPPPLILGIHGWGQNCRRFMRDFDGLRKHGIQMLAAQGPHQFYLDLSTKKVGFNWLTVYDRPRAIEDVNHYLARLLEQVLPQAPYDPSRIWILGFSQGVSMAYRFATAGIIEPAGLIACCADLPPDVAEKLGSVPKFPVKLAHGRDDGVFPRAKMEDAHEILAANGFPVESYVYDGGHEITREAVDQFAAWVNAD